MSILEVVWSAVVVLALANIGVEWFWRRRALAVDAQEAAPPVDPEIQLAASAYAVEHADAILELRKADGAVWEIEDAARAWLVRHAEQLYLTLAERGITPTPLKLCRCSTAALHLSEGLRPTCLDCSGVILPSVVLRQPGAAIVTTTGGSSRQTGQWLARDIDTVRVNGLMTDPPAPGCAKIRVTTDDTEVGTTVHILGANIEPLELPFVAGLRRAGDRIVLELCAEAVEVKGSLTRALDAASWS